MPNYKFTDTKLCAISSGNTSNPNGFYFNRLNGPSENTLKGNQYALTVICILRNYIICITTPDKSTDIEANDCLKEVCCRFREVKRFCQLMEVNSKTHYFQK